MIFIMGNSSRRKRDGAHLTEKHFDSTPFIHNSTDVEIIKVSISILKCAARLLMPSKCCDVYKILLAKNSNLIKIKIIQHKITLGKFMCIIAS